MANMMLEDAQTPTSEVGGRLDPFRLDGMRAMVTGANTGIGQAIAIGLAASGAHVVAAGRRPATETIATIMGAGGRATELLLDLSEPEAAVATLSQAGPLDILINNAGKIRREESLIYSAADWDAVMDVNLRAAFLLSQRFAQDAVARGAPGRIVNIASLLSFQGGVQVPAYAASKHGLLGLTRALANEWAEHGISVNAIAPGYIATKNTAPLRADPMRSDEILGRIPMKRWGNPEDIAGAVTFLCAPASAYITGAVLNVDGGWLAR